TSTRFPYTTLFRSLSVGEGASVPVGAPIAVIGEPGEELPSVSSADTLASAAASAPGMREAVAAPTPAGAMTEAASVTDGSPPRAGRPKASPLARRLAARVGVDLRALAGSGPNGRVIRADVERALAAANGGGGAVAA